MRLNLQLQDLGDVSKEVKDWISKFVTKARRSVDGHLGFGDGSDPDNMFGVWKTYTSNATPNTEDAITHGVGLVPVGYLVFVQDKAASFYKSGTAWTTNQIFLKCSVASVTVTIFIVAPSNQDV